PATAHRHPQTRAAQLAPADDRRHRNTDRLSHRRSRCDRDALQLSRHGPAHLHRGQRQGLPAPRRERPHRRHRLPRRHLARRHRLFTPQPAHPLRRRRMTTIDEQAAPIAIPIRPDETKVERNERLRLLVRSPTFLIGCVLVGVWVVCAIFGNLIAPHNPVAPDILSKFEAPSAQHLFGTDKLGQDVLSRVILGARAVLVVAPLATILGTVLGTTIGLVTGYYRGFVDEATMRVVDAILAIPLIITALLAITAVGPSQKTLILVIGFVFTPIIAKTVRAAVLGEAQLEYVQAARLRNEHGPYVMFAEILPNVTGPIIVEFTVRLGYAIFTVATLAFLGFAADPTIPDWGQDISQHYQSINAGYWWPVLFPSLAIATLIVGINLIADAIAQLFER